MSRKKIVAGNWKMNTTQAESIDLATALNSNAIHQSVMAVLIPPFISIAAVKNCNTNSQIKTGAQNVFFEKNGAYTGEISALMLKNLGVEYVIVGHSERRQYFNETDEIVSKKVDAVLAENMIPIFCCGELLTIRENNLHLSYVQQQIEKSLFHLTASQIQNVVIAYEPVWAIGTGKTASPTQVQEMHKHIRNCVAQKYSSDVANEISILYGGSCKPDNAAELFALPDVDGGLIGGASLIAADFYKIINSFS